MLLPTQRPHWSSWNIRSFFFFPCSHVHNAWFSLCGGLCAHSCASMWRPTVDVGNHPYRLSIEAGLSDPELASQIAVRILCLRPLRLNQQTGRPYHTYLAGIYGILKEQTLGLRMYAKSPGFLPEEGKIKSRLRPRISGRTLIRHS